MPMRSRDGPSRSAASMASAAARSLLFTRYFPVLGSPMPEITRTATPPPLPSPPSPLRDFAPPLNLLRPPRIRAPSCSSLTVEQSQPSPDLAILLEVEGVLADVYRLGNRQAFDVAFQKLGLDCAKWTEPIYADLTRKAAGDEKRMLILFFNRIGWPTSLPTNEKEAFTKKILREKRKALEEFAESSSLSLRPGVENFIDDALNEGIPIVMLIAYSKNGDNMSRSIVGKLGQDRISKIKIVGEEEVDGSFYGQLVLGEGVSSSLDDQLAKQARKAVSMEKQRIAGEVASILKLSVDIDTGPSESFEKIVTALRAGAECAGMPVDSCVLITSNQSGVLAAERIGMPCVVVRSSLTARAEFRSAKAVMDGFGGADLTISKLRTKRWS